MQVTIRLYGNLRRYSKGRREESAVQITEGMTIKVILASLGIPDKDVWMAAVNDQVVDGEMGLKESDLVEVFEPVGGG